MTELLNEAEVVQSWYGTQLLFAPPKGTRVLTPSPRSRVGAGRSELGLTLGVQPVGQDRNSSDGRPSLPGLASPACRGGVQRSLWLRNPVRAERGGAPPCRPEPGTCRDARRPVSLPSCGTGEICRRRVRRRIASAPMRVHQPRTRSCWSIPRLAGVRLGQNDIQRGLGRPQDTVCIFPSNCKVW